MTGNDIVDLLQAKKESNWQRKGWLNKLFTPEEQKLVMQSFEKEKMVWLLWSMKEAVYKIENRQSGIMSFEPQNIICKEVNLSDAITSGKVYTRHRKYFTQSEISLDYIHTMALAENNFTGLNVFIITAKNNPLQELKDYSLIKDERGLPFLKHTSGTMREVSKSHHGRYEAVVF